MPVSNEDELPYSRAVYMAGLIHKRREKLPLTEEEQRELEGWLSNNEANRQLFESLADREALTGELKALLRYDEEKAVAAIFRSLGERPPAGLKRTQLMTRWIPVAASLLLLVSAAWWFFVRQPIRSQDGQPIYNTVTTLRGKQDHLQLPDGSEVWLNAASSITYPVTFSGNTREVTITGEAYFSVAKDKSRPFFVTADAMKVQVVGTEFNVMAYRDEDAIRITLVEGVVKAISTNQQRAAQEQILKPGEQAALDHGSGDLHIEKVDTDEVTGWRLGKFSFHETNMAAIMRQVARWYDVKIEYQGAAAGIRFNGQLSRKERVEELLDIISDTRKVHFEIKEDKTIVVIPGPR